MERYGFRENTVNFRTMYNRVNEYYKYMNYEYMAQYTRPNVHIDGCITNCITQLWQNKHIIICLFYL